MPAMCDHAADGSEKGDTTIDDDIVQDRRPVKKRHRRHAVALRTCSLVPSVVDYTHAIGSGATFNSIQPALPPFIAWSFVEQTLGRWKYTSKTFAMWVKLLQEKKDDDEWKDSQHGRIVHEVVYYMKNHGFLFRQKPPRALCDLLHVSTEFLQSFQPSDQTRTYISKLLTWITYGPNGFTEPTVTEEELGYNLVDKTWYRNLYPMVRACNDLANLPMYKELIKPLHKPSEALREIFDAIVNGPAGDLHHALIHGYIESLQSALYLSTHMLAEQSVRWRDEHLQTPATTNNEYDTQRSVKAIRSQIVAHIKVNRFLLRHTPYQIMKTPDNNHVDYITLNHLTTMLSRGVARALDNVAMDEQEKRDLAGRILDEYVQDHMRASSTLPPTLSQAMPNTRMGDDDQSDVIEASQKIHNYPDDTVHISLPSQKVVNRQLLDDASEIDFERPSLEMDDAMSTADTEINQRESPAFSDDERSEAEHEQHDKESEVEQQNRLEPGNDSVGDSADATGRSDAPGQEAPDDIDDNRDPVTMKVVTANGVVNADLRDDANVIDTNIVTPGYPPYVRLTRRPPQLRVMDLAQTY
ncbi:unnamed protein product [Trichogramma brassicae]|uniref:Uncharacterized protein n=1 Tax=Trichogramma brassicae TaxID=86971 RepID=A0A6H5J0K8_9HYME|nr:unnamed protein product [Trichogramma brassicae]